MPLPTDDKSAITLIMLGEARNQGVMGMRAVGHTVMNRVALNGYRGHTVLEVCMHPYAYSCMNENDPNRDYLINHAESDPMYIEADALADKLLAGQLTDITGGATYYYAQGTPMPKWAIDKEPCFIYGVHLFFKGIA